MAMTKNQWKYTGVLTELCLSGWELWLAFFSMSSHFS